MFLWVSDALKHSLGIFSFLHSPSQTVVLLQLKKYLVAKSQQCKELALSYTHDNFINCNPLVLQTNLLDSLVERHGVFTCIII